MRKKADVFARNGDAAVPQMPVEVLPQVVAKASGPLSANDRMTVIWDPSAGAGRRTPHTAHRTPHIGISGVGPKYRPDAADGVARTGRSRWPGRGREPRENRPPGTPHRSPLRAFACTTIPDTASVT